MSQTGEFSRCSLNQKCNHCVNKCERTDAAAATALAFLIHFSLQHQSTALLEFFAGPLASLLIIYVLSVLN